MAVQVPCKTPNMESYKAGADLSGHQYMVVKVGTNEGEVVAWDGTGKPLGILQNAPTSGEMADVAHPGGGAFLKLSASAGSPAAGDLLAVDSTGKGIKAVDIDAVVCAQLDAVGAAPANSDVVPVVVMHPTKAPGLVSATVGAMTAASPETDTEDGFLTISVGGTQYEVPFYAKV